MNTWVLGGICGDSPHRHDNPDRIESNGNRQPGNLSSGKLARLMTELGCRGDRDYEDDDMGTTVPTFTTRRKLHI